MEPLEKDDRDGTRDTRALQTSIRYLH